MIKIKEVFVPEVVRVHNPAGEPLHPLEGRHIMIIKIIIVIMIMIMIIPGKVGT